MKLKNLFLILFTLLLVAACSSDDDNPIVLPGDNDGENPDITTDYLPSEEGNSWTYENEVLFEMNDMQNSDSGMEILTLTENNNETLYFHSEVQEGARGLLTAALSNGNLKKQNGQFLYTGNLDLLDFEGFPEIEIPLENIPLFDIDAEVGEELHSSQGAFSQSIPVGELGTFPIEVSYTLSVTQADNYDSIFGFEDVKSAEIKISNVSILLQNIPVIGQLQLMQTTENEVMVSTYYLANNTGIIKSETNIDLPLIDLNEVMPIPLDGIPEFGNIHAFIEQTLID